MENYYYRNNEDEDLTTYMTKNTCDMSTLTYYIHTCTVQCIIYACTTTTAMHTTTTIPLLNSTTIIALTSPRVIHHRIASPRHRHRHR